ncbi:hypothetical protein ACVNF4_03275 [Streptomyces sp. S6]
MTMSIRTTALTAFVVGALAAGAVLMAPTADAAPKPAGPKSWTADPVTEGFAEPLGTRVTVEGV